MNKIMNMNNQNNFNNYGNNNKNQNDSNKFNLEFSIDKFKKISNDEEKQSYIGEFIYNHIIQNNFLKDYSEEKKIEYNSKITGIILKCGSSLNELAEMCQNKELLNKTISDTLKVFIKNKND